MSVYVIACIFYCCMFCQGIVKKQYFYTDAFFPKKI